jgi:hypothetical protein
VQISYQLTAADYRYGYYAFRNRSFFSRWMHRFSYVALFFCFATATLLAVTPRAKTDTTVPLYLLSLFWAYILWYPPYAMGSRMIKSNPSARALRTVDITDDGVHSHTELSDAHTDWKTFVGWTENDKVFAVHYSAITFAPIPKRAMTEAQQQEFRSLLQKHITEGVKN